MCSLAHGDQWLTVDGDAGVTAVVAAAAGIVIPGIVECP